MLLAKFDLDSTLINSSDLIELALAESGFMLNPDRENSWWFRFIKGYAPPKDFQWDVFFYRLFTERLDELKPVDEFVNTFLEKIYSESSAPIHVITARPEGVLMHHACMKTLERCFPNVEFQVTIVKSGSEKIRFMGEADIMFEDRRKTALDLAKNGNIVMMPAKDYNIIDLKTYGINLLRIEDLDISGCKYGDIVVYDNFKQVMDSGISNLISSF